MERDGRLELVKDALRILVDELGPDDRVAVVTFGERRPRSCSVRRRAR